MVLFNTTPDQEACGLALDGVHMLGMLPQGWKCSLFRRLGSTSVVIFSHLSVLRSGFPLLLCYFKVRVAALVCPCRKLSELPGPPPAARALPCLKRSRSLSFLNTPILRLRTGTVAGTHAQS
jgi:hypothetical protein